MSSTSMPASLTRSLTIPDPEFQETDFRDYFTDFEFIAVTSHGTVHRAVERSTNRVVAVKTVICDDSRFPNRYKSEDGSMAKDFTILEHIKHPHVLEILAVYCGVPGGRTHIILEFMEGGTLLEYLQDEIHHQQTCENGPPLVPGLPELACRDIMYQLCQAMAYVHRLGVVHCNLKPENILLTGDEMPFIKIAGFGLAISSQGEKTDIRGSFDYAAPEVVNHCTYDHRVDSWSAGITLFAMLLLASPHLSGHHIHGQPVALEWDALHDRLSAEGHELLRGLLYEDPNGRCSMEDALEHRWLMYHRPMYPNVLYK
ncbi:kinase-like domain-containing protein [Mycena latifolia]|nr:kinase-like domain-containing protein [Mycena latifolia]